MKTRMHDCLSNNVISCEKEMTKIGRNPEIENRVDPNEPKRYAN